MAHGVLNTEILQDIAVNIAPIDPSNGSWTVGTPIVLVLDRFEIAWRDDPVRVDAGQQTHANRRGAKWDYTIRFTIKGQLDDFETGKLRDLLYQYGFFRITHAGGGDVWFYDTKTLNFSVESDESNATIIEFEGEQAYA